ncbi:DUF4129 domain-containing protein [Paenarthrobacter sp. NPDC090520]|uniref:DUF4129 domain-containing protein n=1 Tax=Paenarthrobacter sp. NPDC090520 TaxID=3364382 RepID=UPI003823ED2D
MTGLLTLAVTQEPPVAPDRDEARRWAAEELSKSKYAEARPSWLDQAWRDFLDWLNSLEGDGTPGGNGVAVPLIITLAVVLIVVAVMLVRPRLNAHRKAPASGVFGNEPVVGSSAYRQRAATAARDGNWRAAVVDQFRALVRSAEERDVLESRAGRTADEAAAHLGGAFAAIRHRLADAASVFDAVLYGDQAAREQDFEALRQLDADMQGMSPTYAGPAGSGLAVPR